MFLLSFHVAHILVGVRPLPSSRLAQLMAVVYVGMAGAWLGEMVRLHEHVLPIHFLCLLCIVVKMMESILVAVYYHRQVRNMITCTPKRSTATIIAIAATATATRSMATVALVAPAADSKIQAIAAAAGN